MKKLLIIAAHPDDEILGCGATVAKMIDQGWEAKSVILGQGMVSRGVEDEERALKQLREDARRANHELGIADVAFYDFPDNAFDRVPLLEIIKVVEKEVSNYKPDIIFTHFGGDLNIDHRRTFEAVLTATRPQPSFFNPTIYSFFIPSSTDWVDGFILKSFMPNIYFDVEGYIEKKLNALKCYTTEMRNYPHSRSIESLRIFSKYWGNRVGLNYVEPFILVRKIVR